MGRMRVLSEGAEAKVYCGRLLGIDAVIKRRERKRYRIAELDSAIRSQRTKSEARMMAAANMGGILAPKVLLVDGFDIYMERVHGRNLASEAAGKGDSDRMGRAMEKAGGYLGALHGMDIAHGDFTPANLMIDREGKLWLIDFGLSRATSSVEEKALDLLLMKRSITLQQYKLFIRGYRKGYDGSRMSEERLSEIERRGRYQDRSLAAVK